MVDAYAGGARRIAHGPTVETSRPLHHTDVVTGIDGSWLSWRSTDSLLSIASDHSVLSIGSVGSAGSLGSLGSFGSAFSVGSSLSMASVLSNLSHGALLSNLSRGGVLANEADEDPQALGFATMVATVVVVALVLRRGKSSRV